MPSVQNAPGVLLLIMTTIQMNEWTNEARSAADINGIPTRVTDGHPKSRPDRLPPFLPACPGWRAVRSHVSLPPPADRGPSPSPRERDPNLGHIDSMISIIILYNVCDTREHPRIAHSGRQGIRSSCCSDCFDVAARAFVADFCEVPGG